MSESELNRDSSYICNFSPCPKGITTFLFTKFILLVSFREIIGVYLNSHTNSTNTLYEESVEFANCYSTLQIQLATQFLNIKFVISVHTLVIILIRY
jgi:hypothetical protein